MARPIKRNNNKGNNIIVKSDNRKEVVIHDLGEGMIKEFLSRKLIDFDIDKKYYGARFFEDASLGETIDYINSTETQTSFLVRYLECAEEAFKLLLSGHPVYDLLYWFRRIPPSNYFGYGIDSSIKLWHEILTNAIFKYGEYSSTCDEERCKILFGGGLHPESVCEAYIRGENISKGIIITLKSLFRALTVSHFYLLCTQDYRVFNKGGTLQATDNDYVYEVTQSPELQHLVNLFDSNSHNLLSISGFNIDNLEDKQDNLFKLIGCVLNANNKLQLPESYFKKIGLDTKRIKTDNLSKRLNYFPAVVELKEIFEYLSYFDNTIIKEYGFTVKDFIVFNLTITLNFLLAIQSFKSALSVLGRGYATIGDFEQYKQVFERKALTMGKMHFQDYSTFPLESIFKLFTSNSSDAAAMNLWTGGPRTYFYHLGNNLYAIDYSAISSVINYFAIDFTNGEGTSANFRGDKFEIKVKRAAEAYNFDIWVFSRMVKFRGAIKKQIDCSFTVGEFLFLLEAKSFNVSFGYDKGDKEAIDYRRIKLEAALEEVESTADFLVKYLGRTGIAIPKQVKYIVPVVVSAFPEFIWDYNQHLFLDKAFQHPRIMPLTALKHLHNLDFQFLSTVNYVRKLSI